ncbi:MAG TPA: tRNA uridine-5-carboxymethylaminomethyl(34) synthesis GTPase MnmE [Terriglobia bacterium]|jgi:tRNA modification GTPase|nr:tRNA uridine-5-carboxymethylaminomethyl(34) synthesis GTPase MnmE [Terriglobia bacterium]
MLKEDTIVAIATPPGRGGIAVVRLSGKLALEIALQLVRLAKQPPEPQRASLGKFIDPENGEAMDDAVLTFFRGPHSYTGEDVVEISCHGSPVITAYMVECCLKLGARAAEPGEFSMRAFLNGRIDLTQAEAVRDLIESRTLYQARVAAAQLGGALSARLKPHKHALLELIARLEAGIDFADDDVEVMDWADLLAQLDAVRRGLERMVKSYAYGRIVREGLSLSVVGRPNVGKSSLFNRLLNMDRAIVTEIPGTTRDLVSETASMGGIPVRLVDTAGIRTTADQVEQIGVERTRQAMADSDVRLLVVDTSQEWTDEDSELLRKTRAMGQMLVAANKSDLPERTTKSDIERAIQAENGELPGRVEVVATSALTGQGVDELRDRIVRSVGAGANSGSEGELITNLRHQQLLKESLDALGRCRRAAEQRMHHEMLLLDLYEALKALDTLTGATDVEDVLGIIFSRFCIGK